MHSYPLQLTCLGVIYGTPALAAVFVALRVYTRRKLSLRLSWDDWLIIVATILSIALIGPSHKHVKMWHVGVHIWDVPPNEIEPDYDEYYAVLMAFNLLNIPILPLVKASIILLLLRAGSVITWLRKALYAILVFTTGSALIPWFLYIFICPPQTGNTWKPRTFGNLRCMGRLRMGEMLIWVTCANLLTDLLILPIPFIIVRRMMSARLRSRLVVLTVFACSLAVTAIGGAKIYLSYRDRLYTIYSPDWTYPIDYCINHIENNVAIIVANIPILRGLVTRWVYNFRHAPAQPIPPESRKRPAPNRKSSGFSEKARRKVHKNRVLQKLLPCIDDLSSSLATPERSRSRPHQPEYPLDSGTFSAPRYNEIRRDVTYRVDRYESGSACEKAEMRDTAMSVGSATLVESTDGDWRKTWDSSVLHAKRSSPTLTANEPSIATSPLRQIHSLAPARLKSALDGEDFDFGDDIWSYTSR